MTLPGWETFREANPWRRALALGVGLLVLLGLGFGAWGWYSVVQARGAQVLLEAGALAEKALLAKPADVAQWEAAIRTLEEATLRHPSNRLTPSALYHLGNLRYQVKSYEAARAAYALALTKGAPASLADLSRLGIGYTWEAEGKYAEALQAYQAALLGLGTTDFLYEDILLAMARAQELLGKPEQARETYRRILRENPSTQRADDIRWRLASLDKPARP